MTILVHNDGPVRIIEFNSENKSNPFGRELQISVTQAAAEASRDESVGALVLTGGEGRFFSAGGDFNEVKLLTGGDDVDEWIDTFMELYLTLLNVPQPTFAAIDGHAIGMGLQVALMLDWRIMSDNAMISMPELRHGLGGSVGGAILTALFGAETARETMLGALELTAENALTKQFVQDVVPQSKLISQTLARAHERAAFPSSAYRNSKYVINSTLEKALKTTAEASKKVHREAFRERAMHGHLKNILGKKRYNEAVNVS